MLDAVPDEWERTSLGDVVTLEYGRSLPESSRISGNVPVYGSNGVVGFHSEPLVPERGIVVGRKGTAGSVHVTNGAFWPIDTTYFVRPRRDVDFDWLAATLDHAKLRALNEATGVPGLNRDKAYRQPVLLPPNDEQRRIAEVLGSVNRFIQLTSATLVAAQSAKNAALIAALGEAWPETTVEEILATTRYPMRSGPFGSALLKSELVTAGIPFLGIDNVQVERFVPTYKRFISQEKYRELARYTVYPDDVMVTIMGTVGRCCVVPPDVGTAISSKHVWTLTLDVERYSPDLLAWQINHAPWVLDQLSGSSQGGIMSAISSGTLRGLVVPLPPPIELRAIEQLLLSCNATISALEAELENAVAVKGAIMDDLLSGRVRVPA